MRPKKNKRKLLIAITIGVVVSFIIFSTLGNYNKKLQEQNQLINSLKNTASSALNKTTSDPDMIKIVVAKKPLASGTKLTKETLDLKEFKITGLPPGHIKNIDSIIGFTLNKNINENDPITTSLLKELQTKTLEIPQGLRAITIPIEYIQGFASYINIGSKLDIVAASRESAEHQGKLIVQNVKIISFEKGEVPSSVEGQKPIETITGITIELPAVQTQKLVEAMVKGKLQLVTRNTHDNEVIKVADKPKPKIESLSRNAELPINFNPPAIPNSMLPPINAKNIGDLPLPATPKKASKPPQKVELIQANVKSDVTFND
ncbi:MAG: Flp pilus assembly protein CpaB [Candidatus Melainabacteria bacterium GWF2_32_7]|nr:MAG: Flp pilus assembly protein CpaB [Candidatus Melainabacteria bacterium GWF2_32_7]